MAKFGFGVLTAAIVVAGMGSRGVADDWPRYRGASTDGISRETGWLGSWAGGSPRTVWKAKVGTGFSSVTVADGRLFTAGNDGKQDSVFCLDAAGGREIWRHVFAEPLHDHYYEGGPGATPTVADGRVYTVSKSGLVQCLEVADGRVAWSVHLQKDLGCAKPEWGFNGSVHLVGDLAILNAGGYGVALRRTDGSVAWQNGKGAAGYGTPVPFRSGDRDALALFAAEHVVAIEPLTGRELWRFPWKTSYDVNAADPVIAGNLMFLSSGYGKGCAAIDFGGASPRQLWFNKELRNHMASPILIDGHVYGVDGQGGDKDSHLKCLDLRTGAVKWTSPKADTGALAAVGGRLLWLTGRGELVVVEADPAGYREVVRAQVGGGKYWTAPVLAGGRVYVRNARGDLTCVDVRGDGPVD